MTVLRRTNRWIEVREPTGETVKKPLIHLRALQDKGVNIGSAAKAIRDHSCGGRVYRLQLAPSCDYAECYKCGAFKFDGWPRGMAR